MSVVLVDGPHDGLSFEEVSVFQGDTVTITDHPQTVYKPVEPYPQHDDAGFLKLSCVDRGSHDASDAAVTSSGTDLRSSPDGVPAGETAGLRRGE